MGNLKGSFPLSDLQAFTGSLEDLTGVDAARIADALGLLGTFELKAPDAKKLAMPIVNATEALKAQGVTMEQLAVGAGKAIQIGDPTNLRRAGVIIDAVAFKAASAEQRVTMLAEAFQRQGGDAAIAFKQQLPGALQALSTQAGNLQEALGNALGGPVSAAGAINALADLTGKVADTIDGLGELSPVTKGAVAALGVGLAVSGARAAWGFGKATIEAGKLSMENAKLTNEQLRGTQAAKAQAAAEGAAAQSFNAKGAAAAVAAPKVAGLAAAQATAAKTGVGAAGAGIAVGAAGRKAAGVAAGAAGAAAAGGAAKAGADLANKAGRFKVTPSGLMPMADDAAGAAGLAGRLRGAAGAAGRLGKLAKAPGLAGLAILGADMAMGQTEPTMERWGGLKHIANRSLDYAGPASLSLMGGAQLGIPITAIAAVAGAVKGLQENLSSEKAGGTGKAAAPAAVSPYEARMLEIQQQQLKTLQDIRANKLPLGTGDMAGARQAAAMMMGELARGLA